MGTEPAPGSHAGTNAAPTPATTSSGGYGGCEAVPPASEIAAEILGGVVESEVVAGQGITAEMVRELDEEW